jgi:hypothetical protein
MYGPVGRVVDGERDDSLDRGVDHPSGRDDLHGLGDGCIGHRRTMAVGRRVEGEDGGIRAGVERDDVRRESIDGHDAQLVFDDVGGGEHQTVIDHRAHPEPSSRSVARRGRDRHDGELAGRIARTRRQREAQRRRDQPDPLHERMLTQRVHAPGNDVGGH